MAFVFVDGKQDREEVWNTLAHLFWRQAPRDGFAATLPVAPKKGRFHEGGAPSLRPLLISLRSGIFVRGNGMHAVGIGEGGLSALAAAKRWPHEFASLTLVMPEDFTAAAIPEGQAYSHLRVRVLGKTEPAALAVWRKRGLDVSYHESAAPAIGAEKSAKPWPHKAVSEWMWKTLRELDKAIVADADQSLHETLDRWHAAVARADAKTYWGLWAKDGVFLPPDVSMRWSVDEFRRRSMAPSRKRPGWILVPSKRFVRIAEDGKTAWVDELLGSVRLGQCRGTAMLVQVDNEWRIARYCLSGPKAGALLGPGR